MKTGQADRLTRAIGLMSGTSMDGVDVALIETDGEEAIILGPSRSYPYSDKDRTLLREAVKISVSLSDRRARPDDLARAEALVTRRHAEAVEDFLIEESISRATIDLIGFHGQTVLHRPEKHLTVQIGDGVGLACRLKIPVAFDFRAADVAEGGQGAPLVPVFHRALVTAAGFTEPVVVINIGGVANLTFVAPGEPPLAFDTGPGNALIDDLMQERLGLAFDPDGVTALQGMIHNQILEELLAHPYFAAPPPKSLDRNDFSRHPVAALSAEDAAATLTAFTAASLARAFVYLPESPSAAVLCGGGACNKALLRELANRLPCRLVLAETLGWSSEAMEAQAFAYLGVRRLKKLPITFPTTTGVDQPLPGGILAEVA
ncbi:MAG TPA: anhydro-N-acetylmuramic acid kinase [Methylocella sp.]|nr:anhydro-N-acetylmuramic acid kinase [Methylocella sp.]